MKLNLLEIGMHWFPDGGGGGADRYFHELISHLQNTTPDLKALVFSENQRSAESDVECLGPRSRGGATRLRRIRASARRFLSQQDGPAVIATHFALYALPLLDLFRKNAHVVHFHGPWSDESAAEGASALSVFAKRQIERVVYSSARRFIVLSEAFAGVLANRFSISREKINVIPGGIDAARFRVDARRSEARARLGWPADRQIVLCVRRLAKRMGLEELIDAMSEVRRQVPGALLLLGGTGRLQIDLAARIAATGNSEHAKLLGFIPEADLPWAYRAADLSIVPSQCLEGFGLITLESLAAGTPVLVTPVGGLPETVHGLNRDLVLAGTAPRHLAEGIVNALAGHLHLPDEKTCREFASANYDWNIIASRVLKVYKEVTDPQHHGSPAK